MSPADTRSEHRPPWLIGERDAHVGTPGERLEQRPLGAGQVLESVRIDRLVVPGGEVRLQPLGRATAQEIAIPEVEPVELGAVGRVQGRELAVHVLRIEQSRLELADRAHELVGEPTESRRRGEAVQRRSGEQAPHEQCALRRRDEATRAGGVEGDALEEIVECADRAAEERGLPGNELTLDPIDVRPVRHDENRLPIEGGQIAVEQALDLARVGRPRDETQRHRPIVERAADGSSLPLGARSQRADYAAEAADFGLRPRRAAGWPGLLSAHSPQRSACFAPRRASEYVMRITAPLASSTSLPQLSQTRIVLRAMPES